MDDMDKHNAGVRLRKIADQLKTGGAQLLSVERFNSANSPHWVENHIEIISDDMGSVTMSWMEHLA